MKRNGRVKNTLADQRPDVAAMWDYERNGDITPDDVSYGMDRKKLHWRCEIAEDHRWQATPNSMTGPKKWGTGCPFCAGRRLSDTNRLDLNHPEIASQWFHERNGDVTPERVREGTTKSFWWKCDKGPDHEWLQQVRVRVKQGTDCPFCAGHRVSVTNSLAALYPKVAEIWAHDLNDGLTPRDIVAKTNKKYTWRCPKGSDHIWEAIPNSVTRPKKWGSGCPFCAGKRLSVTNRLDLNHPEVASQWFHERNGDLTPDRVVEGSNNRFWWKCDKGPDHEWTAKVNIRTQRGTGCPFCVGHKVSITNSLATRFPEIASEWSWELNDPLTPDDVTHGSNVERWWVCNKGPDHKWKAAPGTRTNPSVNFPGCPFCASKKVSVTNSLATKFPDIAAEWDYERNGDLTPDNVTFGADRPAHWICPDKGHRYETRVSWRTSDGTGCAECHVRPASLVELTIKFELSEFFNVDLSPTNKVRGESGRKLSVDILLPDDEIIIEYDGHYYHKEVTDRYESDSRKTDSLKSVGKTVIRMREEGLGMIGPDDIQVPRATEGRTKTEQKKAAVNLILRHLEEIMGRLILGSDEYISRPNLRRYDEACAAYDAIRKSDS